MSLGFLKRFSHAVTLRTGAQAFPAPCAWVAAAAPGRARGMHSGPASAWRSASQHDPRATGARPSERTGPALGGVVYFTV